VRIGFIGLGNMGGPTLIPAARGHRDLRVETEALQPGGAPPRGDRLGRASEGLHGEREGLSKDQFSSLEVVRVDGIEELPDVFTGFDAGQTPRMFFSSVRHAAFTTWRGERA
jgi:hypothetical protein